MHSRHRPFLERKALPKELFFANFFKKFVMDQKQIEISVPVYFSLKPKYPSSITKNQQLLYKIFEISQI